MAEVITVTGLRETQKQLYSYSQQLGDKVVIAALRQGANLIKREAQKNAPVRTGTLKRGFRVARSKIHRGKMSGDMIGVYLTLRKGKGKKDKRDPFYGRWQEHGWNVRGKAVGGKGGRAAIRADFGGRTGRKSQRGKRDIEGKKFITNAYLRHRVAAANLIAAAANRGAEVLKRKLRLR